MRFKCINCMQCLVVFWWCIHVNSVIFYNLTTSSNISRKYHEVQIDQLKEMFNLFWTEKNSCIVKPCLWVNKCGNCLPNANKAFHTYLLCAEGLISSWEIFPRSPAKLDDVNLGNWAINKYVMCAEGMLWASMVCVTPVVFPIDTS